MKLLILIIATLAIFCTMIDAVFVKCDVVVFEGGTFGSIYQLSKTGNDIARDCYTSYFKAISEVKGCGYKISKVFPGPTFDKARIELNIPCRADGTSVEAALKILQAAGFKR